MSDENQSNKEKAETYSKRLKRMHSQLKDMGEWPEIDDYHQSFGDIYENIHNYIKPFTKPVKIYLFKKRQRLKMTIRVTDTYAMTYYWDQDAFEDMIYNWHKEWEGKARGMEVFIGPKSERGGKRFVRLSFASHGCGEHRLSRKDMMELKKDYEYQRDNTMPWDN